ncbi:hypothetical protein B0H15DRAFT_586968 [Mycena belliarum]|uniref:F-box domain-containing protein n=1 Tax=Mycena belliarum TaxID=1033014 RepID=A0AAD6XZ99_9AGAR|nr:hypothetical protein B0H15DRAFT_586968 [Mycena belliae]
MSDSHSAPTVAQMHTPNDDLRSIVAHTTAEIHRYQDPLRTLEDKRPNAQLELDSVVCPILTLPPEITSGIFIRCLDHGPNNSRKCREAPMLLLHVCRTWRDVAISTRALWTTVNLMTRRTVDEVELEVGILKTWFDRAGNLPLSVKLEISWELRDDAVNTIYEALAGLSCRVQSLELHTSPTRLPYTLGLPKCSFPLLRTLTISHGYPGDLPSLPIEFFKNSPLLSELSVPDIASSFLSFPWHQLSKFTGTFQDLRHILEVVRLCPNLTEISLATSPIVGHALPAFADFSSVKHSNIRSLTLFATPESYHRHFPLRRLQILDLLTLPALRTFQLLQFEEEAFRVAPDAISSFLSRSSAPLQKFVIHSWGPTLYPIEMFYKLPTALVDLEIWAPRRWFLVDFFRALENLDPDFLPRLRHLAFLRCTAYPDSLSSLEAGLAARWRARPDFAELSFRFAWISNACPESAEDFEVQLLPFKRLVAEGMDIRIEKGSTSYI